MNEPAYISASVLGWARKRAQLSVEVLAAKTNVRPEKLVAWERGEQLPTFRQAQHLAGALHVPFGMFFLPAPPEDDLPIRDFRTKVGLAPAAPSAELLDAVSDVQIKQDWYREYLATEGANPASISKIESNDPKRLAKTIRSDLALDEIRAYASSREAFFSQTVEAVERRGILVMKSSIVAANPNRKLDTNEFRGFTLNDPFAPVVFINGADARAAQIFTLAHELGHVYKRESGISNERINGDPATISSTEYVCNQVAAELLVPEDQFLWNSKMDLSGNLQELSRRFKVSRLVILRRAFDTAAISRRKFFEAYETLFAGEKKRDIDQSSGGNFFYSLYSRNSKTFTKTLVEATMLGKVRYQDAAQMLHVKVPTLRKIREELEKNL